jgi:hypothetical protein
MSGAHAGLGWRIGLLSVNRLLDSSYNMVQCWRPSWPLRGCLVIGQVQVLAEQMQRLE